MGGGPSKKLLGEIDVHHAASTVQGRRQYNEDRYSIVHPLTLPRAPSDHGHSLFSVFDGHGGEWAAEYLASHLHEVIAQQTGIFAGSKEKEKALKKAFTVCDERCLLEQETSGERSGSTAVCVLIDHTDIYSVNCGDTRAVLCRNGVAIELSCDHKPSDEEEKKRIEAAGGRVPPGSCYAELRDKGLAVSRAFGNLSFKQNPSKPSSQQIIIPDPFFKRLPRHNTDEFIIVASDGLWNIISHQAAVDYVRKRLVQNQDLQDLTHKFAQYALDKKSQDNVTIIIITFPIAYRGDTLPTISMPPPAASTGTGGAASPAASSNVTPASPSHALSQSIINIEHNTSPTSK